VERIEAGTMNLVEHFENLKTQHRLPSMQDLLACAHKLSRKYSTLQAYELAKLGELDNTDISYHVQEGSDWVHPSQTRKNQYKHAKLQAENSSIIPQNTVDDSVHPQNSMPYSPIQNLFDNRPHRFDETDLDEYESEAEVGSLNDRGGAPLGLSLGFHGDWPLANSILMMHNGILFLEVCQAVASGDIGRVWEVLKVCSDYCQFVGHCAKFKL